LAVLAAAGGLGWFYISREHREAANLPLNAIDFSSLNGGTYQGEVEGGMYKWRTNACEVIVSNGQVMDINLISSKDTEQLDGQLEMLYDRVIESQSLQADTVSGATLTSNSYLQAIENALVNAQN
jgi:uncharacterized protein with FMN-binding domain